ncbi:phosphotransferase family protein [Allokutzneria oryzae]|uniref:Phosphotransferase family protein n=1 Tax=Allokutzneria oryzae TaxID=1378989 RepID=A0ABV6A376_9PSEU
MLREDVIMLSSLRDGHGPSWSLLLRVKSVLVQACDRAGIDPSGARLVNVLGTAVFLLPDSGTIAKVILSPGLRHRASSAVRAARLLAAHGVPAVRLAETDCEQPVLAEEGAVTFWRRHPESTWPVGRGEFAALLKRLHAISIDPALREWDPVADLRTRVADATDLDPELADWLLSHCDEVEKYVEKLSFQLPRAVIHGDAQPANVLSGVAGAVLADLDGVCVGPAEWDLVPTAVAALRLPGGVAAHRELADFYGFDVTTWDGFNVLRRVRELELVTIALPMVSVDRGIREQMHHRLRVLRAGDDAALWDPYR